MGKIKVNVVRDDAAWVAVIPSLKRTRVEERHLPNLDMAVRRVIAEATNVHADDIATIELNWHYDLGDAALERELASIRETRATIARLQSTLVDRTEDAARVLIAQEKYSVREIALLAGVSPGRVTQITPQGVGNFGRGVEVPPRGQGVTKAVREAARAAKSAAETVEPVPQTAALPRAEKAAAKRTRAPRARAGVK